MEKEIFEILSAAGEKEELALIASYNDKTQERFGLYLIGEEARALIAGRNESLAVHKRVEFGLGVLPKLIFTFCDSQYINLFLTWTISVIWFCYIPSAV